MPLTSRLATTAARAYGFLGSVAARVDEFFEYVTLLLPGNGTNGAQNNTFVDSSTNNFTITRNGNTTQGTFSPFSQTGWGNYFDGSGDYLSIANTTELNLPADFTIEFWWYPMSLAGTQSLAGKWTASQYAWLAQATSSAIILNTASGGSITAISNAWSPSIGNWYHIAFTRSGTSVRAYVNGTQVGTTQTSVETCSSTSVTAIGANPDGPQQYTTGYISNLRVVKGTAVYTANFTPPTTALTAISGTSLLTCQSNRFIDNSTNNFTITRNGDVSVQAFSPFNPTAAWSAATNGGSGYFDGSGDYLLSGGSSVLNLSTGDWTIQGWYYPTAYSASNNVIAYVGQSAGDKIVIADISTGGSGLWYLLNGSAAITSSTKAPLNAWSFFALVKSGSTTTLYLNGVSLGTTTSVPTSSNKSLNLGSDAGAAPFQGYLSDFRILNGTANTAVPTAPLTAITNTALLLNFTNAGIYDATSKNDLETVGNAQISTTQSKFGGSSMYFDGNGDYLFVPASLNLSYLFGSGDFTVEAWIYPSGVSGFQYIASVWGIVGQSDATYSSWVLRTNSANLELVLQSGSTTTAITGSGSGLATNTWQHVAATRYGNTVRLFINGVQVVSSSYSSTLNSPASAFVVGLQLSNNNVFTGYIDDLRITKGIARYTSNFTPPTLAFPVQ